MSALHTAGPWRTRTGPGWHDTYIVGELVGAHEPTIATVRSSHGDHGNYLANARLIAAAPTLLMALEFLLEQAESFNVAGTYFHQFRENRDALDTARDAIARALGSAQ